MVSYVEDKKLDPKFGCDDIHLNQYAHNMLANIVLDKFRKTKVVPEGKDLSLVVGKTCQE